MQAGISGPEHRIRRGVYPLGGYRYARCSCGWQVTHENSEFVREAVTAHLGPDLPRRSTGRGLAEWWRDAVDDERLSDPTEGPRFLLGVAYAVVAVIVLLAAGLVALLS